MRRKQAAIALVALSFVAIAAWQFANAAWIQARALVAQQLIAIAWQKASTGEVARRPWPWADLRPVARIAIRARHVESYVLDTTSPRALAYGPGLLAGTPLPAAGGNTVIVAHRDTHFAFLREVEIDDVIDVESNRGNWTRYRVSETTIIDQHDLRVVEDVGTARLTLITCFPFDAVLPGTPLRYVVVAQRIA